MKLIHPLALAAFMACAPVSAGEQPAPAAAPTVSMVGAALNVADAEHALKFYTDGLGMKLAAHIANGTSHEYILAFGDKPAPPNILLMHDAAPNAPKIERGTNFSRLVLRVSDLAAMDARLTAQGYEHGEIRDASHGYRVMYAADPEGNRLELVQNGSAP
jgi:catechol 2,3-dioxygenase-like lactoylglutathione lyase family enzyme